MLALVKIGVLFLRYLKILLLKGRTTSQALDPSEGFHEQRHQIAMLLALSKRNRASLYAKLS